MLAIASTLFATSALAADLPSREEMWRIIQQQQQEQIKALQTQASDADQKLADTDAKAEAAVEAVEQGGMGSGKASWAETTKVGGYAEVHYNNLEGSGGASDKDSVDVHRVVIFLGHEFSDKLRFFTEIEWEHGIAGEGKVGETEVEQAYVEMDFNQNHRMKAGVLLLPVGIMNETHEPDTFCGVETLLRKTSYRLHGGQLAPCSPASLCRA